MKNTYDFNSTDATKKMQTPCRNICRLGERDVCVGCGRTLQEIADWTSLTDTQRTQVMERLSIVAPVQLRQQWEHERAKLFGANTT